MPEYLIQVYVCGTCEKEVFDAPNAMEAASASPWIARKLVRSKFAEHGLEIVTYTWRVSSKKDGVIATEIDAVTISSD